MIIAWTYWNKSQDAQFGYGGVPIWNWSAVPGTGGPADIPYLRQRSLFSFVFSQVFGRIN